MRNRFWLAVISLAVAVGASGCATMPTSGEPHAFDLAAPDTDPVEQLGFGPQRDSSPERIISDFLRASAAGGTDDYATAKLYLTDEQAATWNPQASVIVYPTDQEPTLAVEEVTSNRAVVRMSTLVNASLAQSGVLAVQDDAVVDIVFSLERGADGQWRILQMDDGIVLSQANFQAAYQSTQLFFLAPDQETLVPDPRWFPRHRLASHLMAGLLAGPSDELAPVVYSALTGSLKLPMQGVEISGQTAHVRMEGELPTSEQTQRNISRQVSATLLQLTNVTEVETAINSLPLPQVSESAWPQLDLGGSVGVESDALVISDGDVWFPVVPVKNVDKEVRAPARSPQAAPSVAWLEGKNQLALWGGGDILRFEVSNAAPPSVDRWNWVWTVRDQKTVIVVDTFGNEAELDVVGVPKGNLVKVGASPDGVRLLLLYEGDGGLVPYTSMITRDVTGTPRTLNPPMELGIRVENILDASWAGYSHLVFLGGAGSDRLVTIVTIGGFSQTLGAPADTVRISGGSQSNQILLGTEDGDYFSRSGGVWRTLETDVRMLSYAG